MKTMSPPGYHSNGTNEPRVLNKLSKEHNISGP